MSARPCQTCGGDRTVRSDTPDPQAERDRDAFKSALANAHDALTKINAIRDSIVGSQTLNWSEHIYPLVAVLDRAGYVGVGYTASRANLGTLFEQNDTLKAELAEARGRIERSRIACETIGDELARNGCDCDCGCDTGGHNDDCDPCFACEISTKYEVLRAELKGSP